jgi:hypothetical protein
MSTIGGGKPRGYVRPTRRRQNGDESSMGNDSADVIEIDASPPRIVPTDELMTTTSPTNNNRKRTATQMSTADDSTSPTDDSGDNAKTTSTVPRLAPATGGGQETS